MKLLLSSDTKYAAATVLFFGLIACVYQLVGHQLVSLMFSNGASIGIVDPGRWDVSQYQGYYGAATSWFEMWYLRAFAGSLFVLFAWQHRKSLMGHIVASKNAIPISLLSALLVLAWANRFIQDDAFISFRYAQHLAEGYGLVWNKIGIPVEGYTNFLWTLIIAIPHLLQWDAVLFSWIVSLCFYLMTLVLAFRLSMLLSGSWHASVLVLLFLGSNYTFSAYATGGLETQMQVALVLGFTFSVAVSARKGVFSLSKLAGVSILAVAAVLTRLDSILLVLPIALVLIWSVWKEPVSTNVRLRRIAMFVLPGVLIAVVYAIWKFSYYGGLLPNTFYAKAADTSASAGLRYVSLFFLSYGIYPFAVASLYHVWKHRTDVWIVTLLIVLMLWTLYVVAVGGCFMEFRLMVPVLPIIAMLIFLSMQERVRPSFQILLVVGLSAASFVHARYFNVTYGVESISELHGSIYRYGWKSIGEDLGRMFNQGNDPVVLATTAAGAIPYYSELQTIDMFGLNDRFIAIYGAPAGDRPGHQKVATLDYLLESGVHLVIGHPRLLTASDEALSIDNVYEMADFQRSKLPAEAERLEVIMSSDLRLPVLYLKRHPLVDRAISEKRIVKLSW